MTRSLRALPVLVLALAVLLPLVGAGSAAAVERRTYATTIEARDDTDFTLRSGAVGNRCNAWSRIEGHVTTTITGARPGELTLYDLGGRSGAVLGHDPLNARVTTRLRTTGTEHAAFPCGCGPTSELGRCPAERPDEKVDGTCRRTDAGLGTLGMTLLDRRPAGLARAPIAALVDDCPLAVPELLPDDFGVPRDVPLDQADVRKVKRLKPKERTEVRASFKHMGRLPGCTRSKDLPERLCGVFTFTMDVRRTS